MFAKKSFDEVRMIQGSECMYLIPGTFSGGVFLGHVSQENVSDPAVDTAVRAHIQ